MVVQHFPPEDFSRSEWPGQAQKIMDDLKLNHDDFTKIKYTNPPIVPGEVYLGRKYTPSTSQIKLFYIPPNFISEASGEVWAMFGEIYPPKSFSPNSTRWVAGDIATKMTTIDNEIEGWEKPTPADMKERIEKNFPEYISLTQLKKLFEPMQFMNWMSERPLSPKEEPKITKEEPKEPTHPSQPKYAFDDIYRKDERYYWKYEPFK